MVEPVEPIGAKGKAEPVPAHRLLGVIAGAEARARRFDAPMIGRELELGAILDRLRPSGRRPRMPSGDTPGRGRRREVAAGSGSPPRARRQRDRPARTLSSLRRGHHVLAGGRGRPPGGGNLRRVPSRGGAGRIADLLEGVERSDRIAEGVAELIGLGEGVRSAEEGFWAVRRFFEGLARTQPLVLVFDDIHWGEETFLDLLNYVLEWTSGVSVLVVCLARRELLDRRPGWAAGSSSELVALESLRAGDCVALLRGLLGTDDVPGEVTAAIAGTAEGNPLFVEELLAMLIDDGLLVRDDGRWLPAPGLAGISVPPTVQALLAARLEQLDGIERRVLEGASVVGEVFEWSAVAELVPAEVRPDLGGHLMSLVRKEVIRPAPSDLSDEDAFQFRHLLIRDAAYEGMAKDTRAELHERFARWLGKAAPERLPEVQAIVGYHLEQAFLYREELGTPSRAQSNIAREAARHLGEAGERALARADMPAAANLLGRAVALLPSDDAHRPQLTIELVDALRELGEFDRVEQLADDGVLLARAVGNRSLELRFELRRNYLRLIRDPKHVLLRDLVAAAEEIAAEAVTLDDPVTEGEALLRAGRALGDIGQTSAGERTVARAKECFERAGIDSTEMAFVTALTFSWQGPNPVPEDIERGEQALSAADEASPIAAFTLIGLAVNRAGIGEIEEARSLLRRGASILRELGMTLELAATVGLSSAAVEMMAGDLVAAEAAIRPAYETLREMGEKARRRAGRPCSPGSSTSRAGTTRR